jgi:PGF-pre-PGF domain-containing protein
LDEIDNNPYFQFKAKLETTNASISPQLTSVNISYSNDTTLPTVTFACTPISLNVGQTLTCTCSASDASGINSTSYTENPSTSSAGTFSTTCTVLDSVRNSLIATASYTILSIGIEVEIQPKAIFSWSQISPETPILMTNFDEEIGVKQIQIEVNNEAQNVKVTVKGYDGKPAEVSVEKSGKVHRYLQIETKNLESELKKGIVTINVEKSWISDNNLDKDQIALFKFNEVTEKWEELITVYKEEDGDYYYYDIELDSFSYFAIGGKVVGEGISEDEEVSERVLKQGKIILWFVFGVILIASVILIVILIKKFIRKRRENIF